MTLLNAAVVLLCQSFLYLARGHIIPKARPLSHSSHYKLEEL